MRSASSSSTTVASMAASLPKPLDGGQPALQDGGHGRFVELDDDLGSRHPRGHGAEVGVDPLGEGLREVAAGAGVDDGAVAPGALEAGGQRPGTRDLHLERAGPARRQVVEGVEVAGQELVRPPQVDARPRDESPAGRGEVDGEVDEERRAAPDHVRARPAVGQLGEVGEVGQLPDDEAHRLGRVGAGEGPDARGRPPGDGDRPRVGVLDRLGHGGDASPPS